MIIGLTGGTGTGKSSVCDFFRKRGYLIIDADIVSREVCAKGEKCLGEIADFFGNGILDKEGNLMRRALGDIVFNDKSKLETLNQITHKHIKARIEEIILANKDKNIVLDAPLLFEAGLDGICDIKVCVLSDRLNRARRIMTRDGISETQALARIDSQQHDDFYISRCQVVIYNNGDLDSLMMQMEKEFENGSN